jgi:hypothetical protein
VFWSVSSSCSDRILCAARDFFKEVRLCADVLSGIDSLISDVFLIVSCGCASRGVVIVRHCRSRSWSFVRVTPLSSCRLRFFRCVSHECNSRLGRVSNFLCRSSARAYVSEKRYESPSDIGCMVETWSFIRCCGSHILRSAEVFLLLRVDMAVVQQNRL